MRNLIKIGEDRAARQRVYFDLRDATDGMTPENGEAGGQPQVSSDGGAWTDTGIGLLNLIGHGRYYAEVATGLVSTVGTIIETRYKSSNTAESWGDSLFVVNYDPAQHMMEADPGLFTEDSLGWRIDAYLTQIVFGGSPSGDVTTTLVPYLTAAQFLSRYDKRTSLEWASDDDDPLTEAEFIASTMINDLLLEASGEVESACLMGERYSVVDLQALTGATGQLLKGIVGGLFLGKLWGRRPRTPAEAFPTATQQSQGYMEQLYMGRRIFGLTTVMEAGRIEHEVMTPRDIEERNFTSSKIRRWLGMRANMEPTLRGAE